MAKLSDNFVDYMFDGIVWMSVCEDCKNDIEERIRNPEGERYFYLTTNTPVLGSQTLCSRCYDNDGEWKPAAFTMEWRPPGLARGTAVLRFLMNLDAEDDGWPADADLVIEHEE